MNRLNDNLQNIIFTYIHQMKFRATMNELNKSVSKWCEQQLVFRYCKARHTEYYNKCINEFKCLNDYEDELFIYYDFLF